MVIVDCRYDSLFRAFIYHFYWIVIVCDSDGDIALHSNSFLCIFVQVVVVVVFCGLVVVLFLFTRLELTQALLHCFALVCFALRCLALHCITLHYIALHCIALHCIALHCIALHCIALHYIALRCLALHCLALPCITLHYIALHCIASQCLEVRKIYSAILCDSRYSFICFACTRARSTSEGEAASMCWVGAFGVKFWTKKIFVGPKWV
jgi:hypothetical protein